jgi:hypothetical protein
MSPNSAALPAARVGVTAVTPTLTLLLSASTPQVESSVAPAKVALVGISVSTAFSSRVLNRAAFVVTVAPPGGATPSWW